MQELGYVGDLVVHAVVGVKAEVHKDYQRAAHYGVERLHYHGEQRAVGIVHRKAGKEYAHHHRYDKQQQLCPVVAAVQRRFKVLAYEQKIERDIDRHSRKDIHGGVVYVVPRHIHVSGSYLHELCGVRRQKLHRVADGACRGKERGRFFI